MVDIGSEIILKFGSHDQKEQFLIPLAKGEKRMSIAFAESEDGKDFSSISTVAERRGEEYLIHGEKTVCAQCLFGRCFHHALQGTEGRVDHIDRG